MKYAQFKAFEKHLEAARPNNFSQVYAIFIKDPGDRIFAVDQVKAFIKTPLSTIYPDSQGEKRLAMAIESNSLFQEEEGFFISCEKIPKAFQTILEKALENLPRHIRLIVAAEALAKNTTLFKTIEKKGVVLDLGEEKAWEKEKQLAEWLVHRASQEKKDMDGAAVNALARGVKGSFSQLSQEVDKLFLYTGERKQVTLTDVHAVCQLSSNDTPWMIGEALLKHDLKKALEILHQNISEGESAIALLRLIRHQFHTALEVASYVQQGKMEGISEKFPYLRGSLLEKQVSLSSNYGVPRLMRAIQLIDFYEFKAKDQLDDPYLLFDLLCARL